MTAKTRALPIDFLAPLVTVVGVIVVGWLGLDGRDIGQSAESVAQLLIAAAVFGAAVYTCSGC